jgi:hypothetical protein
MVERNDAPLCQRLTISEEFEALAVDWIESP